MEVCYKSGNSNDANLIKNSLSNQFLQKLAKFLVKNKLNIKLFINKQ